MARKTVIVGLEKLDAIARAKAAAIVAAATASVAAEVQSIEGDARGGAPRKSGELQDGIQGKAQGTSGEVVSSARHGMFVEFGTTRSPAQPHMGPAANKSRSRFTGRVASSVRKAVT